MFFPKINFVTARKKIFKIFLQLLKVKKTYKLNIYIYIDYYAIFSENPIKRC